MELRQSLLRLEWGVLSIFSTLSTLFATTSALLCIQVSTGFLPGGSEFSNEETPKRSLMGCLFGPGIGGPLLGGHWCHADGGAGVAYSSVVAACSSPVVPVGAGASGSAEISVGSTIGVVAGAGSPAGIRAASASSSTE